MQVEEFERAVSTLFAHGNAPVSPENRCEAEQYLTAALLMCVALHEDPCNAACTLSIGEFCGKQVFCVDLIKCGEQ
ncbi:hypothetical protein cyc_05280 [Cyclospora cayetanensis]|uniref:Uncharacterized protein n=1 Tax=Cyclospora cayetanensis TaxID=88456 RepID=A0A1D3D1A8_9EIME|nr:hypothetical protein cyc_05280 [Cyclospora cayetanensis]